MHPKLVRQVLWPLPERLVSRPTGRLGRELEASQWFSPAQLKELQAAKLRRLLTHAYNRCPFYRERIRACGVDHGSIALADLSWLPLLTKEDIRKNIQFLIDPAASRSVVRTTTGGSSGQPLTFYLDRARQAADQAARARTRRWFGIEIGERELFLWGSPIEVTAQDRLKRLRDTLTNQRLLNAFEMTPATMSRYLAEMRWFDPVHLFGYPSSIARLVRHAREIGRSFANPALRAVFVTGEVFDPADRVAIEEAVSCPVADGYGAREAGFIAHQCPHGSYHVTMESLIVEVVDSHGRSLAPDEEGEIVVTHLDAMAMPFIRYRTGDLARMSAKPCACGRGLECLKGIRGRKADRLRTPRGEAHPLSLIYVIREHPAVREFKIIQQRDLSLEVLLVADSREINIEGLGNRLSSRIGADIDVRIKLVSAIPPDPSGKHRCVVSLA